MYLPPLVSIILSSTGNCAAATQQSVATTMGNFFSAWNASADTTTAAVVSQVGNLVTPITSIRVGNVFDAQRRRRNTVPESYLTQILT